jgi:hypothetical protein
LMVSPVLMQRHCRTFRHYLLPCSFATPCVLFLHSVLHFNCALLYNGTSAAFVSATLYL